MGRSDIYYRLQKKLAIRNEEILSGPIGRASFNDEQCYHSSNDKCSHSSNDKCSHESPKEVLFNINNETLPWLGEAIIKCVSENLYLRPYSSETFNHPTVPLSEIPGLKNLFQQACLHYGLMGYLEWFGKNNPSDFHDVIETTINNIIIITCGSPVPTKTNNDQLVSTSTTSIPEIIHDIDQKKLNFIRKISTDKFNDLISRK